jgi:copper homeostasis protein (lipoprotein)
MHPARLALAAVCSALLVWAGCASSQHTPSQQSGLFVYLADAASIELCADGRRVPVAMEGDFLALQSAYLKARREPGQALLATFEGRIASRPSAEPGQPPRDTLVVERFVSIRDARACEGAEAAAP